MSSARDPFVTEVMRIIQKETYRIPEQLFSQRKQTIILVSHKFYTKAIDERDRVSHVFKIPSRDNLHIIQHLLFRGHLLLPAPWLTDYEFEIRPPASSVVKATAELLSIPQVADLCSVSQRTLHRLMKSDGFPSPIRLGGGPRGTVRFRKADIERWIAGCAACKQQ